MSFKNYGRSPGPIGLWGKGNFIRELPQIEWLTYSSFRGGIVANDASGDLPEDVSPSALDMTVLRNDRIAPGPGLTVITNLGARNPTDLLLHTTLNYGADLVMLVPPEVGVYNPTHGIVGWGNFSLNNTDLGFAHTNFGEVLLFSDGSTGLYAKTAAGVLSLEIVPVPQGPSAWALASFAARVLAGGVLDAGTREPMAIQWSAADSDYSNWTGYGSGFELLVGPGSHKDAIVSMIPMGFDVLGILCRRSLWAGLRTGSAERPVDFQFRLAAPGPFTGRCAVAVPEGVAYLSEDGLYVFDGTVIRPISTQINPRILPLNTALIERYSLAYNPKSQRLYLSTPGSTWVYHMVDDRWLQYSWEPYAMVPYFPLVGESDTTEIYTIARDAASASYLAVEDSEATTNIAGILMPSWTLPLRQGEYADQMVTYTGMIIEHVGGGSIDIYHPDVNGVFGAVPAAQAVLLSSGASRVAIRISYVYSGMGLGALFRITQGKPEITKIQLSFIRRAQR